MAKGTDINAKDKDGKTPLDYASQAAARNEIYGDDTLVELLKKHGARSGAYGDGRPRAAIG